MTDRQVIALAGASVAGSLTPSSLLPLWLILALTAVGYAARRPWMLIVCVALLCSTLAQRSWSGLDTARTGTVESQATVVSDAVRSNGGTTAILRLDGERVLASGWGASGARLGRTDVGEQLLVEGTYKPFRGSDERRAALHVGTRLTLTRVEVVAPPNLLFRLANGIRAKLSGGAGSLSDDRRALFTGLVYGDDREQDPLTEADFRLAGLTHLLAVSGQNVAYVLALSAPAIGRLSLRGRWVATLGVLLVFATVTRFEASVLRATAMAGLAVSAQSSGSEAKGGRLLALAVTLLLVVDPLLASTVAFRLSVAASGGIAWLRPIMLHKMGDAGARPIREALSVTMAAQLGVAPLLISTFGPVSLISLPANVLAGPFAGAVMTWGMTAGMLAGFAPPWVGAAVHLPTDVLLWALEAIARNAGRVPLAPVGLRWISLAVVSVWAWPFLRSFLTCRLAIAALWLALTLALVPAAVDGHHEVGPNSEVWVDHGHSVLVLRDTNATTWLLDDLRARQIRRIDIVFVADASASAPQVAALQQRIDIAELRVTGVEPQRVQVGASTLVVAKAGAHLELGRG